MGRLRQDAEAFYKDHIAARRLLLKLDTAIQMQVLRRAAVHDVVVGNTVLLPAPGFSARLTDEELKQKAEAIAEGIQSVKQAADEAGAQLLYTLVPEQRTVFAEYYPDWMDNPGQQTKRSRQALFAALERAEIPALDLTPGVRAAKRSSVLLQPRRPPLHAQGRVCDLSIGLRGVWNPCERNLHCGNAKRPARHLQPQALRSLARARGDAGGADTVSRI